MVAAAGTQASQLQAIAVVAGSDVRASQLQATAVYNYPSEAVRASQLQATAVTDGSNRVRASQLQVVAVVRGRIDEPNVRAWTFTQDGHDFYVLRLGSSETLVFDTYSQQWSVYGTGEGDPWRAYTGRNWQGGRRLSPLWSDVIVGDDGNGSLYFLSPDDDYDDDPLVGDETPRAFTRQVTGQVIIKPGYISAPCFGVQLYGSIGSGSDTLNVNLKISDDRGFTYDDMGDIALDSLDYNARANWLSLGSMVAPGRLFRITDAGALKRVDSLETDD